MANQKANAQVVDAFAKETEHGPYTAAPVASNEDNDPRIFWKDDPCDDLLPSERGFITDCVYYTRGREVTTLYIIWSALSMLTGAVKRESWLKWADGKLFSNIYCMIVGPAGAAKKNTAIDLGVKCLNNLDLEIADKNIAGMKRIKPFVSKATPEKLVNSMLPENRPGSDFVLAHPDGSPMLDPATHKPLMYHRKSELSVFQTELSVLMGKQSYMEGLTQFLLDAYDCKDEHPFETMSRGTETLVDIFMSFIGAITPISLVSLLPDSASGDGFLSRCQIVYQAFTERRFREPTVPDGAPSVKELRRRLAWIASNTFGEWKFSEDSKVWLDEWYIKFKDQLENDGMYMGIKSRMDVTLYKLAMLVRWQRYDRSDKLIHKQDVIDAEYILRRTFHEANPIYRMIFSDTGTDKALKVEQFIQRRKKATRRDIQQRGKIPTTDIATAIEQLCSEGKIEVWSKSNTKLDRPYHKADEVYIWVFDDPELRVKQTLENIRKDSEEFREPLPAAFKGRLATSTADVEEQSISLTDLEDLEAEEETTNDN